MGPTRDEADLIRAAAAGDRQAFDDLVALKRERVVRTAYQVTGNLDDALDVAQAVFIKLWQGLHRFDPRRRFDTWLYRITQNAAIDLLRSRGPKGLLQPLPDDASGIEEFTAGPGVEAGIDLERLQRIFDPEERVARRAPGMGSREPAARRRGRRRGRIVTPHPPHATLRELDALPAAERAAVLDHVRTCRACRAVLVAARPEALFGLLAARPLPPAALDRLSREVAGAIDRLEARPPVAPWRRWVVPGAVAASLLLALLIGTPLLQRDATPQLAATPAAPAPVADPVLPVRGIELLSSPGDAEVVDFAIGDAQIVMIFDKELDI
jgi:RNA polymerase sigma factor (sigma-70 family)